MLSVSESPSLPEEDCNSATCWAAGRRVDAATGRVVSAHRATLGCFSPGVPQTASLLDPVSALALGAEMGQEEEEPEGNGLTQRLDLGPRLCPLALTWSPGAGPGGWLSLPTSLPARGGRGRRGAVRGEGEAPRTSPKGGPQSLHPEVPPVLLTWPSRPASSASSPASCALQWLSPEAQAHTQSLP